MKLSRQLLILAGFILLSLTMRFFSFFPTLLSHDEGTFFVIAREIFSGKMYFVDVVDTKPIGIFLILGLFIKYCSSSIFMIRLFTAFVVALTAYVIYRISIYDQGEQKPAIAAGVMFIFMISIFRVIGVFINPELFYTLFTALGFYIYIRSDKPGGFLLVGLLMGVGFILKYIVIFDLAAWMMYYFIMTLLKRNWKALLNAFFNCSISIVGFLIPFAILVLYYYRNGHLQDFWSYTFGVTSRIPVDRTLLETIVYVADFQLRFFPVLLFFYYALLKTKREASGPLISNGLIITWCLMVLVAIIIPGKSFSHYFIQIMLPVCIVAGRFFRVNLSKPRWMDKIISYPAIQIIVAIIIIGNVFIQKHDYFDKPDMPKQVAEYLKPRLSSEDLIYTGNYQQVLYYLLEKNCPTKYVHRTLMCDREHRNALQINLHKEMVALMAINFKYILMKGPYCYRPMNVHLRKKYIKLKEFPDGTCVYIRK